MLLAGCFGLSEDDEARLSFFQQNSRDAYDRGDYLLSLHQANMALSLDEDDPVMLMVKGFSQLKLGKATNNVIIVDEALDTFEALADTSAADDDYRVGLGLGSAHLARALLTDHEIDRVETRLQSEFLSDAGRAAELKRLEADRDVTREHLAESERALRRVLAFPLQKDNLYALMELVLVLNAQGGRDTEAIALARRALELNDESSRFTQAAIEKNKSLSAAARIDLTSRVEANRDRERLLRDLIATVYFNARDYEAFLAEMDLMEARGLLGEAQYNNRATVREALGQYDAAAEDLQSLLRMRVRRLDYEQDQLAPEIFARIDALRARHAAANTP